MEDSASILKNVMTGISGKEKVSESSNTDGINGRNDTNKISARQMPKEVSDYNDACPVCLGRGIIVEGDTAVPCSCMEQKRIENSFRYARLSRELMNCRFDKFNLSYYKPQSENSEDYYKNAQKALKASREFVKNVIDNPHEIGLLFTGSVGSGKTYLAASIANELIENQAKVLFLIVPDLLDELRASYSNKTETTEFDLLDIARSIPVLILDDLGAHNYTEWSRNRIYTILNYRMNEQLPTIITTNLNFEEIEQYLGERTCSRLLQMCRIFRLSSEQDIRMQKYVKREKNK